MLLFHDTASIISLYSILNSGTLKSATELGLPGTSGEDHDFIFFSPVSDDFIFNIPGETIVLDFDFIINTYTKFFINSSNVFGPIDGTMRNDKTCDCLKTFYSESLLQTEKNKLNPLGTPCLEVSLKEMIDYILSFPQNHEDYINHQQKCEGGPELGVYENKINLLGALRSVRIRNLEYYKSSSYYSKEVPSKLNMSIEELYDKILNKIEKLGAEVVIVDVGRKKGGNKKRGGKRKKMKTHKKIKNKKLKNLTLKKKMKYFTFFLLNQYNKYNKYNKNNNEFIKRNKRNEV